MKIFLIARERDIRGALALMEQGVDPNMKCPDRDYTPLIAAVFNKVRSCMVSGCLSHVDGARVCEADGALCDVGSLLVCLHTMEGMIDARGLCFSGASKAPRGLV